MSALQWTAAEVAAEFFQLSSCFPRGTWNLPELPPGPVKNLKEFTLVFECSPAMAQSLPEFSL